MSRTRRADSRTGEFNAPTVPEAFCYPRRHFENCQNHVAGLGEVGQSSLQL